MVLAVVIITFNEEKHIVETIESAKKVADEILVIDSGSTDDTVMLAKKQGAQVLFRPWNNDFAAQRNFAQDKTAADWILYIDADERISDELATSIKVACQGAMDRVYVLRRHNVVFGKEFKYGVFRPDKVVRLYPRKSAHWEGAVHERLVSRLPQTLLEGILVHYTYDSWDQYYRKFDNYTSIWAQSAFARNKHTSLMGAWGHAIFSFIRVAIFNLGLLDGPLGWVMCKLHYKYTLTKYTKLYRLQNEKKHL